MSEINVSTSNPMVAHMPACLVHGGIEAFIEVTAEMINQSGSLSPFGAHLLWPP